MPHLAPEIGDRPVRYQAGSLHVAPQSRVLHVYPDSVADAVKLEQGLIDIP